MRGKGFYKGLPFLLPVTIKCKCKCKCILLYYRSPSVGYVFKHFSQSITLYPKQFVTSNRNLTKYLASFNMTQASPAHRHDRINILLDVPVVCARRIKN